MEIKKEWREKGYADEPVEGIGDLRTAIKELAREKNAVILGHYYTGREIQEVADFIGDSLQLAEEAAKTGAAVIVMCGVHFMAETCKILCPEKKVLCPDIGASCSLAESCPAEEFEKFVKAHEGYTVISYVNTSAKVKALTDVVVTSANARQIVESFPKDEKIVFGPDRNLGAYINQRTGRRMVLWEGACHVHERFSVEGLLRLKEEHKGAKVLAHPECKAPVLKLADVVGSTAKLLAFSRESEAQEFIVATESGILTEMEKKSPEKRFYPVPPEAGESGEVGCGCNECAFMKLNTLPKLYNCLRYEWPEVDVEEEVRVRALKPIMRMLELSK